MNDINWMFGKDSDEMATMVGKNISIDLSRWKDEQILLLLSGGSALKVLDSIETEDWQRITLFFLDERYDVDNENSNFAQLEKMPWFEKVTKRGCRYVDSRVKKDESLELFGDRLENDLQNWLTENPNGKKIAVFGMGADGHVAGIFPYSENPALFSELFEGDRLVAVHNVQGKNPYSLRATMTFSLFYSIDKSYAYICGNEKRDALTKIFGEKLPMNDFPAGIFRELKNMTIVTDIKIN